MQGGDTGRGKHEEPERSAPPDGAPFGSDAPDLLDHLWLCPALLALTPLCA
jgi:hypothetical protein